LLQNIAILIILLFIELFQVLSIQLVEKYNLKFSYDECFI